MEQLRKIAECESSTMFGMNGGQPESPDGTRLVYARKRDLTNAAAGETEIWVCNRDLTGHRKVFTVECGNHNGPSATFVDDSRIVFRDIINGLSGFRILNVDTGKVEFGPVFCKESHCSENGIYPFSISEEFLGTNPQIPNIDACGIYLLDLSSYTVKKAVDSSQILDMVREAGYTPNSYTTSMSHVQLNPSATAVMMRLSVEECRVFGALGAIELLTGNTHFIPDKPVHQLWYDDTTYMATRQYFDGTKIEMESSRIQRFSMDGEWIETLGGVGNHIDGSPDRKWFVGDRAYPGYPADVLLYQKGEITPTAVLGTSNEQHTIWDLKIHPNPTFSRDGKRVYFNHPVSDTRTEAVFVDIL